MSLEVFGRILSSLPSSIRRVSLQGEGESTLHPDFQQMVQLVIRSGREPFVVTNFHSPSVIERSGILNWKTFAISIDSLDPQENDRIGRSKAAIINVEKLLTGRNIEIWTVDYGQDLAPLSQWCKSYGFRHMIQPLQTKQDYVKHYRLHQRIPTTTLPSPRPLTCQWLSIYRPFFTVEGEERPCPFIKDRLILSKNEIVSAMESGSPPTCCQGCRFISFK